MEDVSLEDWLFNSELLNLNAISKEVHAAPPPTPTAPPGLSLNVEDTVGIFLTEKEETFKLWVQDKELETATTTPKKKKKKKKKTKFCLVDGCFNKFSARGLCDAHRRKACTVVGCTTRSKARNP